MKTNLRFNQGSGENITFAKDFSYSGNNATLTGNVLNATFGIFQDGGYIFNGTGGLGTLSSNIVLNGTSGWTVSFFATLKDSTTTVVSSAFGKQYNGFTDYLRFAPNLNRFDIEFATTGTNYPLNINSSSSFVETALHHYVLTSQSHNATHDNLTVYVDGVITSGVLYNKDLFNLQVVGAGNGLATMNGTMDEFIVWNKTLTNADVIALRGYYAGDCRGEIVEDCKVYSSFTMPRSTYNFNDTNLNGVFSLQTGGVTIDCNGSTIYGNFTNQSIGMNVENYSDVKLNNCIFANYTFGSVFNNAERVTVTNSTFINNIYGSNVRTTSHDAHFENVSFKDSHHNGLRVSNSERLNVTNSLFDNTNYPLWDEIYTNGDVAFIYGDSSASNGKYWNNIFRNARTNFLRLAGNDNIVDDNTFTGYASLEGANSTHTYRLIFGNSGTRNNFTNNVLRIGQYSFMIYGSAKDWYIANNEMYSLDIGARLGGVRTIFINNNIHDVTNGLDTYCLGIKVVDGVNVSIINNSISGMCTGIWTKGSNDTIIGDNVLTSLTDSEKQSLNVYDSFDPNACIRFTTTYKSWRTEGLEHTPPANDTVLAQYRNYGANVYNNTCNNFDLLLWTEGSYNIVHDFQDVVNYSFEFPIWLYEPETMFIRSNFSYLKSYNGHSWQGLPEGFSDTFLKGYRGRYYFEYTIYNGALTFKNINNSVYYTNHPQYFSIFGINNPLAYFSNLLTKYLGDFDNESLNPFVTFYYFPNYSVIEGVQRHNDPITVTNIDKFHRKIYSTLNGTIRTNVSLLYFYNNFEVAYPNFTTEKKQVSNYSWFELDIQPGYTYLNAPKYSDTRIITDDPLYIAYTDMCSNSMVPYKYSSETGCNGYGGDNCAGLIDSLTSNYKYTLLYQNYNSNNPPWADTQKSCLIKGVRNNDPTKVILIQAWRVTGNGGQFCSIQNQWNWFVYRYDPTYNNTNLTDSTYRDDLPYYDFPCEITDSTIQHGNQYFPNFFTFDFTKAVYIVLMVLYLILVVFLVWARKTTYAAVMLLFLAFVFLFSNIGFLWFIIALIGGLFLLLAGKKIF